MKYADIPILTKADELRLSIIEAEERQAKLIEALRKSQRAQKNALVTVERERARCKNLWNELSSLRKFIEEREKEIYQ